jgi:hypothetical protein
MKKKRSQKTDYWAEKVKKSNVLLPQIDKKCINVA